MGAGQGRNRRTRNAVATTTESPTLSELYPDLLDPSMTQLTEALSFSKQHPRGTTSRQYLALFRSTEKQKGRSDRLQMVRIVDTSENGGTPTWQVIDGWKTRDLRSAEGAHNVTANAYKVITEENQRLKKEAYQGRISDYELKIIAAVEQLQDEMVSTRPLVEQIAF